METQFELGCPIALRFPYCQANPLCSLADFTQELMVLVIINKYWFQAFSACAQ
jgi:hypothetical protein